MSKLTLVEREELKHHMIDSIVRRLTTKETREYIRSKMDGLDISISHILRMRASLRKDSISQLQAYQKDKVSFLTEIFLSPTDELKLLKKKLHHIRRIKLENAKHNLQLSAKRLGMKVPSPSSVAINTTDSNNSNNTTTKSVTAATATAAKSKK
jgi:hypothetical protein